MSPTIKELDGMPKGEIELLVERTTRGVADDARVAREQMMAALGGRIGTLETRLGSVETRLTSVEGLTQQAVNLSQQAVNQNTEILAKFAALQGEVHEVKEESAEGVKITTRFTRWGDTARDFHLDRLGRWLLGLGTAWGAAKLAGFLFGPEIRDAVLHKLF